VVLYLESEGHLRGSGLAVLIHEEIGNRVTIFRRSQKLQALWLKVEGGVLDRQEDICLGVIYINPLSQRLPFHGGDQSDRCF